MPTLPTDFGERKLFLVPVAQGLSSETAYNGLFKAGAMVSCLASEIKVLKGSEVSSEI